MPPRPPRIPDRTGHVIHRAPDFRVMGDQRELFGQVASIPAAWRALKEAAAGGDRARRRVTVAVNRARRHAWEQAGACRRSG